MRVCVIGAGNGGCAAAAHLTLKGAEVALYNRSPERIATIHSQGGLFYEGELGQGFCKLAMITSDIGAAMASADLVMVTVPRVAQPAYVEPIVDNLRDGQILMLNPGSGNSLIFWRALLEKGKALSNPLIETSTLTYGCRMLGQGSVGVFLVRRDTPVAAMPYHNLAALLPRLRDFYDLVPSGSVLVNCLSNLNPVLHPPGMIGNAGWIQHTNGAFKFYSEGVTPAIADLIKGLDDERLLIMKAYGMEGVPFLEAFYRGGYAAERGYREGSVYLAIKESVANSMISAPPSLQDRYLHEDVGFGLVPMADLASVAEVGTPVMDAIITVAGIMTGVDYRREGLSLVRMGLDGMTIDQLKQYVLSGIK